MNNQLVQNNKLLDNSSSNNLTDSIFNNTIGNKNPNYVLSEEMINRDASPGTFGYLNAFSNKNNLSQRWNIILVNMMTITRNIISFYKNDNPSVSILNNNIKFNDIQHYLYKDIDILTTYIKNYIELSNDITNQSLDIKYKLVFYFPNYLFNIKISPDIYKKPTKVFQENIILYNLVYKEHYKNNIYNKITAINNLVYNVFLDPHLYSSIALYRTINNNFKFNKRITILTHIPIDYFTIKFFPYISFIDSYTGKILYNKNNIANKLFKTDNLPFNKYTHYLLGDKYLLASHLPRGERKKLILKASTYKWNLLSDDQFKSKMIEMKLIDNNKFKYHPY